MSVTTYVANYKASIENKNVSLKREVDISNLSLIELFTNINLQKINRLLKVVCVLTTIKSTKSTKIHETPIGEKVDKNGLVYERKIKAFSRKKWTCPQKMD